MIARIGPTRIALFSCALLFACATSSLDRAPPSPDRAWKPASGNPRDFTLAPEASPAQDENPPIDAAHEYGLAELIDLAESESPDTRVGWERARRAALDVGLAKAEYLPALSAMAIGGFQHAIFPADKTPTALVASQLLSAGVPIPGGSGSTSGHVGIDTFEVLPFLAIRWQLLDFGRGPTVEAAEHASAAANALFTADHQRIIFDVSRAYLRLSAARAEVAVARDALQRTKEIARAAQARFDRGLATRVEVVEAGREVAQSEYELIQKESANTDVYSVLLAAMGIDPQVELKVATHRSRELPARLDSGADAFVQFAMKTRPDLQAAVSQRAATQALVSKSQSAFLPRVSTLGTAGTTTLGAGRDFGSFSHVTVPTFTFWLNFEWELFDFGIRDARSESARSHQSEAGHLLLKLQRQAALEVIAAHNGANAALARYQAASVLERTAAVTEDAVTKSYTNGLSTLSDAMRSQKAHSLASAAKETAFAEALIAVTTLAHASGQLGSAKAATDVQRRADLR